jgi:protein-L-isoaspartate O-methyltransferase
MIGLIFSLFVIVGLLYFIWVHLYSLLRGGPYAPLGPQKVKQLVDLLEIKKGQKAADIGCGDGRIVLELAKQGAIVHGYEINPYIYLLAKWNITRSPFKKNIHLHLKSFWRENFSSFDVVTIYLAPNITRELETKLHKELNTGAIVAVNYFGFSTWKPIKIKDKQYVYKKE